MEFGLKAAKCVVSRNQPTSALLPVESVILPLRSMLYVSDIDLFKVKQLLAQVSPVLLSDVPLNVPLGLPGVNVIEPTSTLAFVTVGKTFASMNNPEAAEFVQPPPGAV